MTKNESYRIEFNHDTAGWFAMENQTSQSAKAITAAFTTGTAAWIDCGNGFSFWIQDVREIRVISK